MLDIEVEICQGSCLKHKGEALNPTFLGFNSVKASESRGAGGDPILC